MVEAEYYHLVGQETLSQRSAICLREHQTVKQSQPAYIVQFTTSNATCVSPIIAQFPPKRMSPALARQNKDEFTSVAIYWLTCWLEI